MLRARSSTGIGTTNEALGGVFCALSVDIMVTHVLTAEAADKLVFLELACVSVDQACPLIHFMPCLLIKLVLVVVILFLEFLREFPNDIVLELEQASLFLVVFEECPPLSELPGEIIRHDIDLHLELLRHRILYVLVYLPVLVQETHYIRA